MQVFRGGLKALSGFIEHETMPQEECILHPAFHCILHAASCILHPTSGAGPGENDSEFQAERHIEIYRF